MEGAYFNGSLWNECIKSKMVLTYNIVLHLGRKVIVSTSFDRHTAKLQFVQSFIDTQQSYSF